LKKFETPAIVFGGGINGLGVVRNLGRNGVTVYCVAGGRKSVKYSRFCKKYYAVPNIQENTFILKKFLAEHEELNGSVLLPAGDLYSLRLSELKEAVGNLYRVPVSSSEVISTLVDKKKFYKSLSKFGVSHPVTNFPDSLNDVKFMSNKLKYPIFVKPCNSQYFWSKFQVKGFVANSASDLMKYYLLAIKQKADVLFQEIIPGFDAEKVYGISGYFDHNLNPRVVFAHRRLRGWPPMYGSTCLRESISIEDVIIPYEATIDYLKKLRYQGLMEAEWKKDPRDSVFKLMEINPRQSMQSSLAAKCGANIILAAYLDAIGEKIPYCNIYDIGVKWVSLLDDIASSRKTHVPIKKWITSQKNVKEWSYFACDDLMPWIINGPSTIQKIAIAITKKIKNSVQRFL
jgi:D-aspartate ligase